MEFRQVRYFLAICDEQNFTRAARRCGISQPSITAAMRRLERWIGGELFVRESPVRLTALGSALQPLFAQIHQIAARVQQIREAKGVHKGVPSARDARGVQGTLASGGKGNKAPSLSRLAGRVEHTDVIPEKT